MSKSLMGETDEIKYKEASDDSTMTDPYILRAIQYWQTCTQTLLIKSQMIYSIIGIGARL
jgi:hypothetical protein